MLFRVLRWSIAVLLLAGPLSVRSAAAVTIEDLLGLKAHGLGDDILVALIQTDGSEFHLTAADIIALRQAGLSETVIRAMIETARRGPAPVDAAVMPVEADGQVPAAAFDASEPVAPVEVPVVESVETEPAAVVVPVPVPVVVVPVAVPTGYRHRPDPPSPVYWGWGGNRRPDSWQPSAGPSKSDEPAHAGRNSQPKGRTPASSHPSSSSSSSSGASSSNSSTHR
ncbi:MAG TPA: hypothetical protein VG538_18700 [Vicinamibacterales bacterium]|jgi:hypothetical protein|nr:hypothetical protein [Vicinamibacterales bacterium]